MAVICAKAPRSSWAVMNVGEGVYHTEALLLFTKDKALLMRFDLSVIPKDQRITKAELTLPIDYLGGGKFDVTVRRLVADWGTGVCHTYRRTYPEKIAWTQAGGLGGGTDRHNKDSAAFHFEPAKSKLGEHTVDITEDIELWYTGAVANRGWILAIENGDGAFYSSSPYSPQYGGGKRWKLQITFEPK